MTDGRDLAVVVRELRDLDEFAAAEALFASVWGASSPVVGVELMRAIQHSGGYLAGAFAGERMVGASVGFLGEHGGPSLHSHISGVIPTVRGRGVGRAMKEFQRAWAAGRGLVSITWTFDPLVRRNAWLNIARLGARAEEYLVDFYGPMRDGINAGDRSDRLLAVWPVTRAGRAPAHDGAAALLVAEGDRPVRRDAGDAAVVLVATPPDVEALRGSAPGLAAEWRMAVREVLTAEMRTGHVVGFTRDGQYVVERSRTETPR